MRRSRHILLVLLTAAMLVLGGTVAFADHGGGGNSGSGSSGHEGRGHDDGDDGDKDRGHDRKPVAERTFTLTPDPAANPEGIEFDKRTKSFFVSITGDGAIYRGTLGSDTVTPFIPGAPGKSAVGIEKHRGKLYVAGGATGSITVYDLTTKQAVATFQTGTGGFLNDLVVTRRGDVYVTDSLRPTLWHVTADQVKAGSGTPQALDVSTGIPFVAGFNLNGIVAKKAHRLVVVQSNTGKLFRIDLNDKGDAIDEFDEIEGVNLLGGDGMILDRGKLVVVQGGNPTATPPIPPQLNFVKLKDGASRAELRRTQTSDSLKGPSTVARARDLYLVVNADFAQDRTPFTVSGLPARDRGHDHGHH